MFYLTKNSVIIYEQNKNEHSLTTAVMLQTQVFYYIKFESNLIYRV